MSKEEFIKKHGDVVLKFSSYYKYVFSYTAVLGEGTKLIASVGGDSDDIYRLSVSNNEQINLRVLDADSAYLYKDNEALCGY